jgi:hypothetical protein
MVRPQLPVYPPDEGQRRQQIINNTLDEMRRDGTLAELWQRYYQRTGAAAVSNQVAPPDLSQGAGLRPDAPEVPLR